MQLNDLKIADMASQPRLAFNETMISLLLAPSKILNYIACIPSPFT